MRRAIVLSGGGARGAYEAGVLRFLFCDLAPRLDRPPRLELLCGTSVGSLHAAWLAAYGVDPWRTLELASLWQGLRPAQIFRFAWREVLGVPRLVRGRAPAERLALVDARPLYRFVRRRIPWRRIGQRLAAGHHEALAVAATEVATGRSVSFYQTAGHAPAPSVPYAEVDWRRLRLGPDHCLASAAIPFFFPPYRLAGRLYVDGSLRQNTPLRPALRLGAEAILVVAVKRSFRERRDEALDMDEPRAPTASFLLGKALNALMLDPFEQDLYRLDQFNALFHWGEQAFGPDFLQRMNQVIRPMRGTAFRHVRSLLIQPREDLGRVAASAFRQGRIEANRATRSLLSMIAAGGTEDEADLLSYFLFDRCFTAEAERLGWEDARNAQEALAQFFSE